MSTTNQNPKLSDYLDSFNKLPWHINIIKGKGPGAELLQTIFWHEELLLKGVICFTCDAKTLYSYKDLQALGRGIRESAIETILIMLHKIIAWRWEPTGNLGIVAEITIGEPSKTMVKHYWPESQSVPMKVYITYQPNDRTGVIAHKYTKDGFWEDLREMLNR